MNKSLDCRHNMHQKQHYDQSERQYKKKVNHHTDKLQKVINSQRNSKIVNYSLFQSIRDKQLETHFDKLVLQRQQRDEINFKTQENKNKKDLKQYM